MKWFVGLLICWVALGSSASDLETIPVGLDSYRQWDKWHVQRIGARAYMRSTYDRRGRNEGADASHFLYQLADDNNVTLDIAGKGILYFARYNHWHGSPWRYVVDGTEHIVQETSTADPNKPVPNSVFMPEHLFPNPLTWTWSVTKGADLMWVPIPFEKSFRMGYSRTHYGTGYYIWHQYVEGIPLSQPIKTWNATEAPGQDVLDLIGRAGTELVTKADAKNLKLTIHSGNASLPIATKIDRETPGLVRGIQLRVPQDKAIEFGRARIQMTWDDRAQPSIDAPVALFFGTGTLYNRDNREYLVKGFPINIRYSDGEVILSCYYPMPFFKNAEWAIFRTNAQDIGEIKWEILTQPLKERPNQVGYFHATYKDHGLPEWGRDLVLLDTRGIEGSLVWSGQFVGNSWIFSDRAVLNTLEGDPRFFFDDAQTPQAYGTGTEEWGGGGDYWGGRNMTLPFAGHPAGAPNLKAAKNKEDQIQSAYRFLLADLMPFGRRAIIRLEHGGENDTLEHYQTVTYWYGLPAESLVKTDTLKVGMKTSELAHDYRSPEASQPYEITSRYEWGVDTMSSNRFLPANIRGKEIYPAHIDYGRKTRGSSEFVMKLDPDNYGVLLRRTLDYSFPNQRAEVFVADAKSRNPKWKPAGLWYLAGGNTCIYSNPREELGKTQHIVQTSNRRFRDDEFLIAKNLTQGKEAIRIKVVFTPVEIPLYPGHPIPELAWSEIRYDAYCFVEPKLEFRN